MSRVLAKYMNFDAQVDHCIAVNGQGNVDAK
jgi:hypothetical protein